MMSKGKHQQALNTLFMMSSEHLGFELNYEKNLLQELVDIYPEYLELKAKATPMKVLNREQHSKDSDAYGDCPICKTPLCDYSNPKGCGGCLQAIDWSKE